MGIYFSVSLLWVIGFGTIFELHKMHWINQNWLTILHVSLKSILPYTAKHLFYQIIIQEHVLITLFLLFWHQTLKIRLIFMLKYRGHFLGSHAKICVTCPIMPMLIYRTRAIITRGLYTFYPLFEVQKRFFKGLFS